VLVLVLLVLLVPVLLVPQWWCSTPLFVLVLLVLLVVVVFVLVLLVLLVQVLVLVLVLVLVQVQVLLVLLLLVLAQALLPGLLSWQPLQASSLGKHLGVRWALGVAVVASGLPAVIGIPQWTGPTRGCQTTHSLRCPQARLRKQP